MHWVFLSSLTPTASSASVGLLTSPRSKQRSFILPLMVFRRTVTDNSLVGSYCILTNQGGLVQPGTSEVDMSELYALLEVPIAAGSVNQGWDHQHWHGCQRLGSLLWRRHDPHWNLRDRICVQAEAGAASWDIRTISLPEIPGNKDEIWHLNNLITLTHFSNKVI